MRTLKFCWKFKVYKLIQKTFGRCHKYSVNKKWSFRCDQLLIQVDNTRQHEYYYLPEINEASHDLSNSSFFDSNVRYPVDEYKPVGAIRTSIGFYQGIRRSSLKVPSTIRLQNFSTLKILIWIVLVNMLLSCFKHLTSNQMNIFNNLLSEEIQNIQRYIPIPWWDLQWTLIYCYTIRR